MTLRHCEWKSFAKKQSQSGEPAQQVGPVKPCPPPVVISTVYYSLLSGMSYIDPSSRLRQRRQHRERRRRRRRRGSRRRGLGSRCWRGRWRGYRRLLGVRLRVWKGGGGGDGHSCADTERARRGRRARERILVVGEREIEMRMLGLDLIPVQITGGLSLTYTPLHLGTKELSEERTSFSPDGHRNTEISPTIV